VSDVFLLVRAVRRWGVVGQQPVGAEAEASPADRAFALLSARAVSANAPWDWRTACSSATAFRDTHSREVIAPQQCFGRPHRMPTTDKLQA